MNSKSQAEIATEIIEWHDSSDDLNELGWEGIQEVVQRAIDGKLIDDDAKQPWLALTRIAISEATKAE